MSDGASLYMECFVPIVTVPVKEHFTDLFSEISVTYLMKAGWQTEYIVHDRSPYAQSPT